MIRQLLGALALACALSAPAFAQHATGSAAFSQGIAPEYACVTWNGGAIGSGSLVPCPATAGGGGGGSSLGGVANASPPTLTEGQSVTAFSFDLNNRQRVTSIITGSVAVTGTFWQATQPISAVSLPLPSGAATAANQTAMTTALGSPFQAGGTIANPSFFADCLVVTGDQAYTVGSTQHCTMTATGRAKVGLSSAASLGTTASTFADLVGTVDPSGNQQALQSDANKNVKVIGWLVSTNSAPISSSTAATTQVVALSSGKAIYVNAFDFIASGATNVTLEYGTGTNCGTGTTALTGAYPLTAQVGISAAGGIGPKLFVPASNALCVVSSAAVQVSGSVSYAQQ